MANETLAERKQAALRLLTQATPAFRFVVQVDAVAQAAFTECSLPSIEFETEELKEGGQNAYVHQLPGRRKSATLSLKNGIARDDLLQWYMQALNSDGAVVRKHITIILLNYQLRPVITWDLNEAYPIKWVAPQLKSDDNTVAIQTLELACGPISVSLPTENE